jgi:flagellar basal body-associated protein FliL
MHMPVIRSNLLMRYGSQTYETMITREGKETLLVESVEDINSSIQKANGWEESKPLIEAAYFTSFVIQ